MPDVSLMRLNVCVSYTMGIHHSVTHKDYRKLINEECVSREAGLSLTYRNTVTNHNNISCTKIVV